MCICNNAVSLSFVAFFTQTLGTAQKLGMRHYAFSLGFEWKFKSPAHGHRHHSLNPGFLNPQPCTLCIKLLQVPQFTPEKYPVGFSIKSSLLYVTA